MNERVASRPVDPSHHDQTHPTVLAQATTPLAQRTSPGSGESGPGVHIAAAVPRDTARGIPLEEAFRPVWSAGYALQRTMERAANGDSKSAEELHQRRLDFKGACGEFNETIHQQAASAPMRGNRNAIQDDRNARQVLLHGFMLNQNNAEARFFAAVAGVACPLQESTEMLLTVDGAIDALRRAATGEDEAMAARLVTFTVPFLIDHLKIGGSWHNDAEIENCLGEIGNKIMGVDGEATRSIAVLRRELRLPGPASRWKVLDDAILKALSRERAYVMVDRYIKDKLGKMSVEQQVAYSRSGDAAALDVVVTDRKAAMNDLRSEIKHSEFYQGEILAHFPKDSPQAQILKAAFKPLPAFPD